MLGCEFSLHWFYFCKMKCGGVFIILHYVEIKTLTCSSSPSNQTTNLEKEVESEIFFFLPRG